MYEFSHEIYFASLLIFAPRFEEKGKFGKRSRNLKRETKKKNKHSIVSFSREGCKHLDAAGPSEIHSTLDLHVSSPFSNFFIGSLRSCDDCWRPARIGENGKEMS